MSGPAIARQLGMPVSTAGAILRRLGLGKLAALEPKPAVVRYERQQPGELIHLDSKKLGIGNRITGRAGGTVNRHHGIGWEALHVCIDDATRLGYSEILPDERKGSAVGFLERALCWFGLSQPGFPRGNRRRRPQTQTHQAVHAAHQRESRAVYPNQLARVRICPRLPHLAGARRGVGALA
jgi:hypothetical protein